MTFERAVFNGKVQRGLQNRMADLQLQRNMFPIFLICIACFPTLVWTLARANQPVPERVCDGTKNGLSHDSNITRHLKRMKERYENCTFVSGNLELTHIEADADLSFLKQIREVTGYILISHVSKSVVSLPGLRIIRGQSLYQNRDALVVILNNGLQELSLPAFREIENGWVYVTENPSLCFFPEKIRWDDILADNSTQKLLYRKENSAMCPLNCHPSCNGSCWGPASHQCQKFTRINCSPNCISGRCYGPGNHECCDPQCTGGCHGPKSSHCTACKNFEDDTVCVAECPGLKVYDKVKMQHVDNPKGKFAYANVCLKECPDFMLRDDSACVRTCQPGKMAIGKQCVPCEGPCPKRCKGFQNPKDLGSTVWLSKNNIGNFTNCTVIEGNLIILTASFEGGMEFDLSSPEAPVYHQGIEPEDLDVFWTVKEITGYVRIDGSHTSFTDLGFLRNLEVIRGRMLDDRFALTVIKNPHLKSLNLRSLRKVEAGGILIAENPDLCYAQSISWKEIAMPNLSPKLLAVRNNKPVNACIEEDKVCHPECDGCWGPGRNQCFLCKSFKLKDICVGSCDEKLPEAPYAYTAGPKECKTCHAQCQGCMGPGPTNCTRCLNVKMGIECIASCPISHYAAPDNSGELVCRPCHKHCNGGCSGPGNFIGQGGCYACDVAVIPENGTLAECRASGASCPSKHFGIVGDASVKQFPTMVGKTICRPCHPECEVCQGPNEYTCSKCVNFNWKGRCMSHCPKGSFEDTTNRMKVCHECHEECGSQGCYGKLSSQCDSCKHYRDPYDTSNPAAFNCTQKCPDERPYTNYPEDSEPVCSLVDESRKKHLPLYVSLGVLIPAIVVVFLVCFKIRKSKLKEEIVILRNEMKVIEDAEPFTPTDVRPNNARIIVIGEKDLRLGTLIGSGAFGLVYKGVWLPPKGAGKKIPVAIKLLKDREDGGGSAISTAELMDEASVMASVFHPHLVRLIGICMTSQTMLITQLMPLGCLLDYVKKEKNINSKMMLTWSSQIAKGMAYLEAHRMIHRDLACRNVLVQTPLWVKVTDFGLAKMLEANQDQYRHDGGKVPVKWLAPECLAKGTFSHKTDVWSFGITIWEIVTYGKKPYEDVPTKELQEYLIGGHRLEQPNICSLDVYMLLLKCWSMQPDSRPSFQELAREFCKMLRDPGRYLVIVGDEHMRLPEYTEEDKQRLMGEFDDGPEQLVSAEEYLGKDSFSFENPDSDSFGGTIPMRQRPGYRNGHLQSNGRSFWPAANCASGPSGSGPSVRNSHVTDGRKDSPPNSRYAMDPVKGGNRYGDSVSYSPKKPSIALGQDEYLLPNGYTVDPYLDLTDATKDRDAALVEDYQKMPLLSRRAPVGYAPYETRIPMANNPEYNLMSSGASHISSDSDPGVTSLGAPEDEDDIQYYNEPTFDRMRREMLPLNHQPKRNETTV